MFGIVTTPSCTLVVTSQTKMCAWYYAVPRKINLLSLLMQKVDSSGLTASKRLFSGRKKVYFILGASSAATAALLCEASRFSSMKMTKLEAV